MVEIAAKSDGASGGSSTNVNYHRPMLFGLGLFAVLVFGIFGWMAFAPLSSAAVATGTVVVRSKPQLVQHLDGGIVKMILVRNGDVVKKGDVVVKLDETNLLANLEIYRNRIREMVARKSRLEAERDDKRDIDYDDAVLATLSIMPDKVHKDTQQNLFDARRATRAGQAEQLREKIAQLNSQLKGVDSLIETKSSQLELVEKELEGVRFLFEQGITTQTRLVAQERARADLVGQLAEHHAEMGRVQNSIREADVGIVQVDRQFKESILTDLREAMSQLEDLKQQITATARQLERIEAKAPASGIVHELAINTVGGTIPPNATLMQIISTDDGLDVEVSVETHAIDQIAIGHDAALRFSAFNQRTTPEIFGKVERISPTSVVDEKTGATFYRVGIAVTPQEIARLGASARILPGMPVEAFIESETRTTLSYLIKPLSDNFWRAMRER